MIKGFFKNGSPAISLKIEGNETELLLDTGFNGHLVLSNFMINKMKLKQMGFSDYMTASGEVKETNIYIAKLNLFDEEIEVPVLSTEGNFSLAGMDLFHNCRIIIERHNDLVEINKTKMSLEI